MVCNVAEARVCHKLCDHSRRRPRGTISTRPHRSRARSITLVMATGSLLDERRAACIIRQHAERAHVAPGCEHRGLVPRARGHGHACRKHWRRRALIPCHRGRGQHRQALLCEACPTVCDRHDPTREHVRLEVLVGGSSRNPARADAGPPVSPVAVYTACMCARAPESCHMGPRNTNTSADVTIS